MAITEENRNTLVFLGFLLLAGITQLLTRTRISLVDTFMFSANFMIYIGLLLFWIQSVSVRLLPTKARSYIIAAAVLMIVLLLIRVLRFRVLTLIPVRRYTDYCYNIPMVLGPTLFLMTCIRIRRGGGNEQNGRERLLLIPSCGLLLLILTNDLHQLFYRRAVPLSEFQVNVGTYTYGPLFYLMYGWIVLTLLAGFAILIRWSWRRSLRDLLWFAAVVLIWGGMSLINQLIFTPRDLARMYHGPEIHIFGLLGFFEVCIRRRLIPYNENHVGFFSNLGLPVRITDDALRTVYETDLPISASENQLRDALAGAIYPDEDTRLLGMRLRSGCAFGTEDERELHREGRRLAEANEILSEENRLIAVENELKEKKAHLDAQNQVYDRIAAALYSKQKRIEALLDEAESETGNFRAALAESCVLNAYCKRKSNLILLSEASLPQPNRELFLALQESARYLKSCGIEAAATGEEYSDFSLAAVHALYDSFETLIETFLPHMQRMTVSLAPNGVRIAVEAEQLPTLPDLELPLECRESDGCFFLSIRVEGGAAE